MYDVGGRLGIASACRKNEPEIALGAGELPFPQHVAHVWRQGDCPFSGLGLGLADRAITIRALPDVQLPPLKVEIGPTQPTKLRGPQTGEDRRQQDRSPAPPRGPHDGPDLVQGGNIDAALELPPLALLRLPLLAPLATAAQFLD